MVATGVHILVGLALVMLMGRSRRPEPYLVAALAATVPDSDTFVFQPLVELGYVAGALWSHRGLTHSLLGGIIVVALLAYFGPRWAAAIGFGSHLVLDVFSGGVQLFAPLDQTLYGLSVDWLLLNSLTSAVAVPMILGGLLTLKHDVEYRLPSLSLTAVLEWLR
ncbi:metal-dependent hydrolase [Natrinema limicola]|uniref:Membrane-bound metal-dependent hydrolase n=1 Tax=Natrinema limicola JCM 13563 TaxID=1230457 RepID=M0C6X9_9EURY|nr:metal-dependent hydrolase [Natrinema limicola]ELZ18102.1 membrane-bound metal-dependent hydrolase [Natrinema limicola JCM 13563]